MYRGGDIGQERCRKVVATGGAWFISLVDALVEKHEVVVLDSLEPQVHAGKPNYPQSIFGDMRGKGGVKGKCFCLLTFPQSWIFNYSIIPLQIISSRPSCCDFPASFNLFFLNNR